MDEDEGLTNLEYGMGTDPIELMEKLRVFNFANMDYYSPEKGRLWVSMV